MLAFEIVHGVILRDQLVRLGAPLGIIGAVEYANHTVRAALDHAVESPAVFRRLNFLRVTAAHGGQIIREKQAALQKVDLPVEFERIQVEQARRESTLAQRGFREQTLVAEIVNRQHHRKRTHGGIFGVLRAQEHRHEPVCQSWQ